MFIQEFIMTDIGTKGLNKVWTFDLLPYGKAENILFHIKTLGKLFKIILILF